ncbi:uncharacterized protein LOC112575728 [Pomacea canaliculata]|uniref:uncharacterized protein LOC112575728 n=1 Tax=Pomacea canaliculata TaxID=400727 RepID=UPI000D72F669|nr:uncharacterized protein LOC112575728 [Pomacea canaliculata]
MANTLLTCHFPEDVHHTKRDFTVYKYSSDRNPDAVLDCWWLMQKLECFVGQGYKYDGRISDKLSLEIPRVSASHLGTYACQLSSYGSNAINTCDLTLSSVGRSVCEVSSVKLKPQTELVCYFPEDLSKTRADLTVYHYSKGAQVRKAIKDDIFSPITSNNVVTLKELF